MHSTSRKKAPSADPITGLPSKWKITKLDFAGPEGPLAGIDSLSFHFDGNGSLFGSVRRLGPLTDYAVMNGTLSQSDGKTEVNFDLVIEGYNYHFSGGIIGLEINGMITSPGPVTVIPETDEGSWSAQAQGFPYDQ